MALQVIAEVPNFGEDAEYSFGRMESQTSVAFLIRAREWLIDVRSPQLGSLHFMDDRSRLVGGESGFPDAPSKRSSDQRSMIFYAHVGGVPLPDATRLRIGGTLEALVASSTAEARSTMTTRVGSTFELAGARFEVVEVARTRDREWPLRVELEIESGFETIRSLAFASRDAVVRSRQEESWEMRDGFARHTKLTYALGTTGGAFDVVADVYTDIRTVSVPVDLDVGVGLGRGSPQPTRQESPRR